MPFQPQHNPFTGVASALILGGVTAVLAHQFRISKIAANAFSSAFYKALAVGDPLDAAAVAGRLGIKLKEPYSLYWAAPVLFMRLRDGKIFDLVKDPEREQQERASGVKIGIRTFRNRIENMEDVIRLPENLKCFLKYFEGRYLRSDVRWQSTIFPELRDFLAERTQGQRNVYLHMDAHMSVAFATGYCLDTQCGFGVTIRQRTLLGIEDWTPEVNLSPSDPLWCDPDERVVKGQGKDVALAISVTHDVVDDVEAYVKEKLPQVGRIMLATLSPKPNSTGLRSATHAFHLAQALKDRIRTRTADERRATLHVFGAAPNAFIFFLAQHARTFGKTVLYEHDFEGGRLGAYSPSLTFPPPEHQRGS